MARPLGCGYLPTVMQRERPVSERYLCIHGHFYQPPRENPWLEHIERQESAYPYHNWNERIAAECYATNGAARILGDDGVISTICNNYANLSFNFGPTLLSWLERRAPEAYEAVITADRQSLKRFGGHGSAMAQPYNHMIMPLCTRRDKVTQVRWGVSDFVARFRRQPKGMWLPETAVDSETLTILAEHGIEFTVLAPHQARRVRRQGESEWRDVEGGRIDPRMAYRALLPGGHSLAIFFYDGPVARAVAFGDLLNDGVAFAKRLLSVFTDDPPKVQLSHIAVDGETFGHHHRHGEMALAYALSYVEQHGFARLTNYGQFLELSPPTHEVEICENTSWSCAHGIERWRSDCGCNMGKYPGGNQAWRRPLRTSLDWLRDRLVEVYVRNADGLLPDPWSARDRYIDVVLDRSRDNVERFLQEQAGRDLDASDGQRALQLLEMQRHSMLMFTSCGWFFDDLARIETVQVLTYAARAIQLAEDVGRERLEAEFVKRLAFARSNVEEQGNGQQLYARMVQPKRIDLQKVAAHYAIRSVFEPDSDRDRAYCYHVMRHDYRELESGVAKLVIGQVEVQSEITWEARHLCFAILHFGDHTLNGGVCSYESDEAYFALIDEVGAAFKVADLTQVVRILDARFHKLKYSIGSLFRDEQRRVLDMVLDSTLKSADATYRGLYEQYAPLMRFLGHLGIPAPPAIHMAGEHVLNSSLRAAFEEDDLDLELIHALLDEAREVKVTLDEIGLGFAISKTLEHATRTLASRPGDLATAQGLRDAAATVKALPFVVDLWAAQTVFATRLLATYAEYSERASEDEHAARWSEMLRSLGAALNIRVGEADKGANR
jgi:alpha-amylase/alpha-mannosidase (GH57 family)